MNDTRENRVYFDARLTTREKALININACPVCVALSNQQCYDTEFHQQRIDLACNTAKDNCRKLAVPQTRPIL